MEPDDLVFNPMWAIEGGVAVSALKGAVSTAYRVYSFREGVVPRFAHYYFRSSLAIDQYRLLVRGATTFDRSVTREDFEAMPMPVPSADEQQAIAGYLDTETTRIDTLITKKRRMIDLLEEQWSSWLDEALRSADEEASSKVPLRYVTRVSGGLTLGGRGGSTVERRPYLRVANVQDGYLDLDDLAEVDVPAASIAGFELKPGDVLMLEGNGNPENLGRGTIWRGEVEGCLHQNHIHAVRSDARVLDAEYLNIAVRTPQARSELTGGSGQVSIATLSKRQIGNLRVPLPSIRRQKEIVEAVGQERSRHNRLKASLRNQATLLSEHRQALITAAVTGELKVPGVA